MLATPRKTGSKRLQQFQARRYLQSSNIPCTALTKIILILALLNRWSIWSLDIKDASLLVPQKRPVKCKIPRGKGSGAVAGMDQKAWRLLQQEGYEKSTAVPSWFRLVKDGGVVRVCIVHVGDLQVAGRLADMKPVLDNLSKKVKL